jgi:diacylglycerol kinase (ATP)
LSKVEAVRVTAPNWGNTVVDGCRVIAFGAFMGEQRKENGAGLARLVRAIRCSRAGLSAAWRNEEAFRQELLLGLLLIPLALWLGNSGAERALLIGSLLVLFIVELLNTAVEVVVDRIGLERHDLSGLAKDLGSAAVSLAIVQAVAVWLLVLFT